MFAVIFYHIGAPFAQGGLLGVTVFFVISGYLITGLLTAEWQSTHTINLPQFWLRRIRRLFPAIFTVIFVMAAVYTFASPLLLTKMRPDIIPGLFWFENWWYIFRDLSYFEATGAPSPLTHFWSLAIEEQFYLIWPIILLGVFKAGANKKIVRRACLVLAAISALAMAILFSIGGDDPSRVYYGTDTRAFSLLIGAWLSFAWPGAQLTEEGTKRVPEASVRMLDIAGGVAFLGILLMCIFINGFSPFMYYGGLVLCSVLSAVVIATLAHPRSMLARIAECKPFVWIGRLGGGELLQQHPALQSVADWQPFVWIGLRSYGMYLWHFPIIVLLQPRNATMLPWWIYIVEIVLTIVISDLSYRFIETPLRRKGLAALKAPSAAHGGKPTFGAWVKTHVPATAITCAVLIVALAGIIFVPPVDERGGAADAPRVMSASLKKPLVDGVYDVVFIGDSVSLGANEQLNEKFPHGMIDTEGNRQYAAGIEDFQRYLDQGVVGDTVVFSLGTNGYVEAEDLDKIMQMAGADRTVWFVNIRVPDERCEPNNKALQDCVDKYENAKLIDWYNATTGHDDWLIDDGIHLTWEGRDAYANLVVDTMGYTKPDDLNTKYDVTFIGDTVPLDAVDALAELFPHGIVDCSEGRSLDAVKTALDSYLDKDVVGSEVVFCIGNEEALDRGVMESFISKLGTDRKIWLINDRSPGLWCNENNALLADLAASHDNVQLIDWFATSQGHDDYLANNGMNLTESGVAAFKKMVSDAMGDHTKSAEKESASDGSSGGSAATDVSGDSAAATAIQ